MKSRKPSGSYIAKGPDGRSASVCRISTPEEVGSALTPGIIVEVSPEVAAACGAWREECLTASEAFEAAEDPAAFDDWEADDGP